MDEKSFEILFKNNYRALINSANSIVKDEDSAQEIVQQVFIKLWEKRESLKIKTAEKAYLHRAVINTSLNHLEKNKRYKLGEVTENINVSNKGVDDEYSRKELHEIIDREIKKLPPKCQTVFSLSRFNGMSNKEIAANLNISIKTVEKQIGKALKTLRKDLYPKVKAFIQLALFLVLLKIFEFLGGVFSFLTVT